MICIDVGVPFSIIGKRQINHILPLIGKKNIDFIESRNKLKFGDVTISSLDIIECELETPQGFQSVTALMDVVPVNDPMLLGLNVLDAEYLYAENVTNRLVHRYVSSRCSDKLLYEGTWSILIKRYDNHWYSKSSFLNTNF